MLIVILLEVIGWACLGFSIFIYKKYKENHKLQSLVFFMILLVISLNLIVMGLKYSS